MRRLRFLSIPYWFWMGLFVLIPTLILIILAFSNLNIYNPDSFQFTLDNFRIFSENYLLKALTNSLYLSVITTVICFLIGYPVAFYLTTLSASVRRIWLSLLIVPLWANMLLRIFAWEKIFTPGSIFSDLTGINIDLLGSIPGVIIGMIGMYLPFMIFPIFSVLEKMDFSLIEAAKDLGATDFEVFRKVVFPLSIGGVVSGVIMTMLPAMTSFVLPERIGLAKYNLIGNIIHSKFMKEVMGSGALSINVGSLISILLMIFSVISFIIVTRFDKEGETLI
ncbi:MAG: ABC transporter permease [Candidatus Izemoplasmatales bacterium]|jgi:spermidine/putrescine transport system permease protein|nr:ABC transporter permease [Candidatus Izemoplasmatales bacterium]NLF49053.1 ABC transporter permease [Acholeplasmataceae bacterium]MDD4354776.1 ABC transporter permease [Candidatus Izemoplasmatales bacterium]MDD4987704.1 ABC transporter permease [Candidatus Izemoplasmatales bacterium]MDD5601884.1 ABC transporter permease [Candidatus Izemoplasmatales bacterium]